MERRWNERIPFSSEVVIYQQGEQLLGKARDMSLEGLFVETDGAVAEGDLQIEFKDDGLNNHGHPIPADAVRQSGNGIGIHLNFDDQDSFRSIRDFWLQKVS